MQENEFRNFIHDLRRLPSLPPVATRLIEVAASGESSLREITSLIGSDPALASKVLKIANSAYFGFQRNIETLDRATALLGLDLVRGLALSIFVIDTFKAEPSRQFDPTEFWRHSLACSMGAEVIARRAGYRQPQEAFVAALLHDIGKLVFF